MQGILRLADPYWQRNLSSRPSSTVRGVRHRFRLVNDLGRIQRERATRTVKESFDSADDLRNFNISHAVAVELA
jgi:hypothetical protein